MTWFSRLTSVSLALTLLLSISGAVHAAEDTQQQQLQRDQKVIQPTGSVQDAIDTVQMAKLMGGYPDGEFHADRTLSRAELASIIVKAFELRDRERSSRQVVLKDVPSDYWAAQDIGLVVNLGIMEGYRNGYFYPNHPISRTEALAVIAQAYGVYQFDEAMVKAILSNYPDSGQIPAWARKAVATSLKVGFVDVGPTQPIRPLQLMTRGEFAYALYQYLQRSAPTEPSQPSPSQPNS